MLPQPATIRLDVISLTGSLWSGEVFEVSVPGREGRLGVMPRHTPLLSLLREGMLHLYPAQGEPEQIYVSGGYIEVQPDHVLVMAELAERNEDLDAARAQAARDRATSPMAENFTAAGYAQLHLELLLRYSAELRRLKGG
jgi:F-type H+-transporting ATPase subunit epsilon